MHTAGGEPLVALVSGEAGVGKTRLADQVAVTAAEQGVLVLRGGCVPLGEEGVPFAPVRGGCSSSCWAWSSGWPREGRC